MAGLGKARGLGRTVRLGLVAALCALLTACATSPAQQAVLSGQSLGSGAGKVGLPVSAAFNARGRVWRVLTAGRHVLVDSSEDSGKTFGPPVIVNPEGQRLKVQSEDRPGIGVDGAGRVFVTYPAEGRQALTTYVAVSSDGGRHFSAPRPISDRWEQIKDYSSKLAVDPAGRAYVFWHDERDRKDYREIGLPMYYAVLEPAGAPDFPNRKTVADTCECCRIAAAFESDGTPVVFSRMTYPGGIRDHGLVRRDGQNWKTWRVTYDDWRVDACPEHGPALSIAPNGDYHVAWFTLGQRRQGLFYARSSDRGQHFSEPMALGNPANLPGHPDVLSLGDRVVLVWKEFDGRNNRVEARQSRDGGRTWSAPATLAESLSEADYPFLLTDGRRIFLSWNSREEGYRLVPVD